VLEQGQALTNYRHQQQHQQQLQKHLLLWLQKRLLLWLRAQDGARSTM
jgi:hypothetical protein